MRAVIQRVSSSEVRINNESVGKIAYGLNVLLGIKDDDTEADMDYIINTPNRKKAINTIAGLV